VGVNHLRCYYPINFFLLSTQFMTWQEMGIMFKVVNLYLIYEAVCPLAKKHATAP